MWRWDGRALRVSWGAESVWQPPRPTGPGPVPTPEGPLWLEPIPETEGFWLEVVADNGIAPEEIASSLALQVGSLLSQEHRLAQVSEELALRYEEIDLLYTISEILGTRARLRDAANTILREVSTVVGASRASIMVYDETSQLLRVLAARGVRLEVTTPVRADDPGSVAAQVFRNERMVHYDPAEPVDDIILHPARGYRSGSFLSVPISYTASGRKSRCVGVMNFTDRLGGDSFTISDQKLVGAVANQVGAAVENERLVIRDLRRQRLQRELELAHDLQLKLMPTPVVLEGLARVAVRCQPAESVGGDFYTFGPAGDRGLAIMLGDVSSHGFSAALVMALVLAAAGIHGAADGGPDATLEALHRSLASKLSDTEMYLTVFYGLLDRRRERLIFANAGHPHAFRIPQVGEPHRLEATAPPLGLAGQGSIGSCEVPWDREGDLLVLWTDGLVDARNRREEPFGEARLLEVLTAQRAEDPEVIVDAVFDRMAQFGARADDDRTLLVLRL